MYQHCSACGTTINVHNGICIPCAVRLRAELAQYRRCLNIGALVDGRRFSEVRAMLADYENPQALEWKDRAIAKLLSHNYDTKSWA